jgi:Holliday junction resolvase
MNKLPALSEKMIQQQIMNYLEATGWYVMRMNSGKYAVGEGVNSRYIRGHKAGTPDIFALKGGKPLFVEVKREGKKPTALQERVMEELRAHGARCIVAHSLDELITELEVEDPYMQTR